MRKLVVHTDLLADHLLHTGRGPSVLRLAMEQFLCYTTVFNAIELFSLTASVGERRAAERALGAMKILGLNARSAREHGARMGRGLTLPRMNSLVAGICLESGLPLLTGQPEEFSGVKGLELLPARRLVNERNADALRARRA